MPSTSLLRLILLLTALGLLTVTVVAQECAPPEVLKSPKNPNIFSPEQEMILGDLTYQNMSREVRFVRDPQLETATESWKCCRRVSGHREGHGTSRPRFHS